MNNIKVSVVLPCYNVEKYIREGLDSIMAQTLLEWEAIMVDEVFRSSLFVKVPLSQATVYWLLVP